LPVPTGSGPGYRRPVLVVQANDFNESRIRTVIVVALTANVRLAAAPGNVLCRRKDTHLAKDSVANVSQVMTIDKSLLTEKIGALPSLVVKRVEEGLRLVLGLQ
jgi:mRNA interferase MazF